MVCCFRKGWCYDNRSNMLNVFTFCWHMDPEPMTKMLSMCVLLKCHVVGQNWQGTVVCDVFLLSLHG